MLARDKERLSSRVSLVIRHRNNCKFLRVTSCSSVHFSLHLRAKCLVTVARDRDRDSDSEDCYVLVVLFIMVALCNRADHYIFILWFLSSSSIFFPRLISAVGDWMSAIYFHTWCGLSANLKCMSEMRCTRLAENTGRKTDAKNRQLGTIAQFCRAISSHLRHVSTIGKTC